MKKMKKLCSIMLALVLLVTCMPAMTKAAEKKDSIPTKARIYYSDSRAIEIELADVTQSISNIKTDNKNVFAMLTYASTSTNSGKNEYAIGVRASKNGTYTVSFDIVDADSKKIATKKVKVYAYGSPVKSITFDGKKLTSSELTGKSANVKVALESGNTIKKLEYGYYKVTKKDNSTESEIVYKTFKNGGKVTFGTKAYTYDYTYTSNYDDTIYSDHYFSTSMDIPTYIRITYTDKYTKQTETTELYYHSYVK
ncbi:hypothetical protein [Anaerosporobacter sp.]|uniref:hypothetical protein n=1 Tax=Anaerosporobacter sp. TaxID=1872529 RepID=UPI00286F8589|nr:hypothetical protein [Anaerosporobacter sp.]